MPSMNRRHTNLIRFVMDDCLPPIIRDNYYFMKPFFKFTYPNQDVEKMMHFKSHILTWTNKEIDEFYATIDSRFSASRPTDLNPASINAILESIPKDAKTLVDIGCGRGYLLQTIHQKHPKIKLTGIDLTPKKIHQHQSYTYHQASLLKLPFPKNAFDVVCCTHTLEHMLNVDHAIHELERITKNLLIIAVPKQRPYYFTLDTHVHFFPYQEALTQHFTLPIQFCQNLSGDWLLIAKKSIH